jgi:hypothetical protein
MKLFIPSTAAALLLLAGACGERARFQPTEKISGVSPSGQPAASYELRSDESSDPQITVNVWSEGAARKDEVTSVDLAVQVRNGSDAEVRLDRDVLGLEAFHAKGAPLPAARLASITAEKGTESIPARSASTLRLRFELAVPVSPDQVGALRFRWGVVRSDGDRYVQFTEFRRQPEQVASGPYVYYDPIFGFYDPFFYGAPYGYRLNHYVPVRRVIVEHRDRPRPQPQLKALR